MDAFNSQQSIDGTDTSLPSPPPWPSSPPDALSLYGIAHHYCRERIIVNPLHWTNRQLELLRISFSEPSLAPPPGLSEYVGKRAGLSLIHDNYDSYQDFYRRIDCVRDLIEEEQGPMEVVPWGFFGVHLKHIPAAYVHCHYMFHRYVVDQLNNYPAAAYIDREFLEALREDSVHLTKCSSTNLPVQALIRHQLKRITPANALKDPYIAALMIALAQQLREHMERVRPEILPTLTVYQSCVFHSSKSVECMHLFKAELPSSLLDMFEYPNVAPPPSPPITIQVFTIPFEPALTFRNRLSALIVLTNLDHSKRNKRKRTSNSRG